ncbi:hypothetical protein QO034_20610 [Sedimentitalea sp. JM2-8]|uniref:Uncharacterized protein n=1 Tax=Sedimentitalea xiamensis TaxID=3050037 RepID=A0ABT7FJZ7_9RHOB|nr:hypothetical protein [Sedimentitalea xiamensis]MDK3075481.1 hypothetical protein [Sedimentitalea xiamensis]
MAEKTPIYSDFQYEKLRLRLLAFQRKHSKTPQGIANDIVNRTGYAMPVDGGRKRVERFLSKSHRVGDDFLAAVEAFLGDFQLIDYVEAAAAISKLSRGPHGTLTEEDIARFAGVYHAKLTALVTFEGRPPEDGSGERTWDIATLKGPAHPVFRLSAMPNHAGLFVWAAHSVRKPEDGVQPEDLQDVPSRGIASRFGKDGLLIIIREPYASLCYNVKLHPEEPSVLYGFGQYFGDDEPPSNAPRPFLPFDPQFEIRMERISVKEEA